MSEQFGLIECQLCSRAFKKYEKREANQVYGLSLEKLKRDGYKLKFSSWDKSEIDRHICTYCISDILNKFNN